MRKTKKSYPLTEIHNLGSPNAHLLDFTREELWKRMDPVMFERACSIPVFLVNPDQMDELYPPKKRLAVSPEYVKKWITSRKEKEQKKRYKDEERDEFEELDRMAKDDWFRYKKIVAVGLYVGNIVYKDILKTIPKNKFTSQEAIDYIKKTEGPAIFICPERVINRAKEKNFPTEIVLDKVYYHELGHAIMDYGDIPYNKFWARTVEESLANAIAFNTFKSPNERKKVNSLIEDQPAEYQTYYWFSSLYTPKNLLEVLEILDELIYFYDSLRKLYRQLIYLDPSSRHNYAILPHLTSWITYKFSLPYKKPLEDEEEEWKQFVEFLLELTFREP